MMYDVRENIENGVYHSKMACPVKPVVSGLLRKQVKDLSHEEISKIAEMKSQHEFDMKEWEKAVAEYCDNENYLMKQFKDDLFAENEIPENNPLGELLYSKAWADGHADGLASVVNCFEDLLDIWECVKENYIPK